MEVLSGFAPYICAALVSLAAHLLASDAGLSRLAASLAAGIGGAVALAAAAMWLAGHPGPLFGACTPLTIGASILGSIVGVSLLYQFRSRGVRSASHDWSIHKARKQ